MMKDLTIFLTLLPCLIPAQPFAMDKQPPKVFMDVKQLIPQIQLDIRYHTDNNFVGRQINGYQASVCLLTRPAAEALQKVEQQLLPMKLTLKIYDCYRPKRAVNDFVHWATVLEDTQMKPVFYPQVNKDRLFADGYIAALLSKSVLV